MSTATQTGANQGAQNSRNGLSASVQSGNAQGTQNANATQYALQAFGAQSGKTTQVHAGEAAVGSAKAGVATGSAANVALSKSWIDGA